jgi:hypothetical protein
VPRAAPGTKKKAAIWVDRSDTNPFLRCRAIPPRNCTYLYLAPHRHLTEGRTQGAALPSFTAADGNVNESARLPHVLWPRACPCSPVREETLHPECNTQKRGATSSKEIGLSKPIMQLRATPGNVYRRIVAPKRAFEPPRPSDGCALGSFCPRYPRAASLARMIACALSATCSLVKMLET